jgi:hypothetical protein
MGYLAIYLIFYIIIGFFWSSYAFVQQSEIYPQSSEKRLLFVFMLNYAIWPICMIVAAYRKISGKTLG